MQQHANEETDDDKTGCQEEQHSVSGQPGSTSNVETVLGVPVTAHPKATTTRVPEALSPNPSRQEGNDFLFRDHLVLNWVRLLVVHGTT